MSSKPKESWIRSLEGMIDFLSLVIVHAPDDFPREDYLRDDEQLTLDAAFEELYGGMRFVEQRFPDTELIGQLRGILDASLAAYRAGDDIKGAHLLHDFEAVLLDVNRRPATQA